MIIRQFFSDAHTVVSGGESTWRRAAGSRSSRIALVVAVLLALSSVGLAAASGDEEAMIRQGIESRRTHDDAAALELFRKAYDLHHSARAVGQMGLAELALGRWVDAEVHLGEAIAASADPWVVKNHVPLKESLNRVRRNVGSLEVLGGPAGAEITVEGVVVGTLPLAKAIRVRSGDCRFVVKAPGYEPVSRAVDVSPGDLTRETVNLSRKAVPPQHTAAMETPAVGTGNPVPAVKEEPASPVVAAPQVDAPPPETPPASNGDARLRTTGIVLGSVGILVVATGVVFGLKARSAGQDASRSPIFDPDADSKGYRYQALQYVGYGLGAALLAAGVTAFVLGRGQNHESGQPQVAIVPSRGGGAFALLGQF